MREPGGDGQAQTTRTDALAGASGRVSFLDQALWKRFSEAEDLEAFARSWLALQCSMVGDVLSGVVVLGAPDIGPFVPVAFWPEELAGDARLSTSAEMAMSQRRGVVRGIDADDVDGDRKCEIAYPFLFDGKLCGAIVIEVASQPEAELRKVMRELRWGAGWIETALRRRDRDDQRHTHDRTALALDLIAATVEEEEFRAACAAAATELATKLDCERVSIGFVRRNRTVVSAVSHSAQFGKRMHLVRAIGAAMDEAIDQETGILYPYEDQKDYTIVRAHSELVRLHGAGSVYTVPVRHNDRYVGAVTFEAPKNRSFDQLTMELCDCVGGAIGPILEEKRRNGSHLIFKVGTSIATQLRRLFGPRYLGRKTIAAVAALLAMFFAFAYGEYVVTSPASLEGSVRRAIVAPFDGYVLSEHRRAGDKVQNGDVIALLDDKDMVLEQLRWRATRKQYLKEYDRALAEGNRAKTNIVKAQIDQADAQIALYTEQIKRSRLIAPFLGIVAKGDLSQAIGSPVQRGEILFEIAPLDRYRVVLEIDETDIREVEIGQKGTLLLSSLPDEPLAYTVERMTPVAEAREGRNYYRVEGNLDQTLPRLRPGMKGVGKTAVEDRRLIWIWTHKMLDWLKIWTWSWMP